MRIGSAVVTGAGFCATGFCAASGAVMASASASATRMTSGWDMAAGAGWNDIIVVEGWRSDARIDNAPCRRHARRRALGMRFVTGTRAMFALALATFGCARIRPVTRVLAPASGGEAFEPTIAIDPAD